MIKIGYEKHTDETVETDDISTSPVRIYPPAADKSVIIPVKTLYIQE